jgi:hypothetical protein
MLKQLKYIILKLLFLLFSCSNSIIKFSQYNLSWLPLSFKSMCIAKNTIDTHNTQKISLTDAEFCIQIRLLPALAYVPITNI